MNTITELKQKEISYVSGGTSECETITILVLVILSAMLAVNFTINALEVDKKFARIIEKIRDKFGF